MSTRFTLSQVQINALRRHGLQCEQYGPVTGTKDIYAVEVAPEHTFAMVKALYRWGAHEASMRRPPARVISFTALKSKVA